MDPEELLTSGDPIASFELDEAGLDEAAGPPSGFAQAFASLRHRDFTLFWSAGLVSNTGSWMQNITVPYVLYQLTHSTTWLGVSAFASFFPALVMGPLAGTVADRYSRRAVLIVTQTILMVVAFSLWWFWVSGNATPGIILAHLLVAGITGGINIASWQAFVPQLVPEEDLLNAVRLNSMQFTVPAPSARPSAGWSWPNSARPPPSWSTPSRSCSSSGRWSPCVRARHPRSGGGRASSPSSARACTT